MRRPIGVVPAVLLALALALGGASGAPAANAAYGGPGAAQAALSPISLPGSSESGEDGSDLGNSRPPVSFDGLMVRRRVVVAVHPTPDADLVALRGALEVAATRQGLHLADVSPNVLGPITLEHVVPRLTVILPAWASLADGDRLIDPASYPGGAVPGVDHFHVESVLVHDLRFTIRSSDPAAATDAIAREGILSDALGTYDTAPGNGELVITYTGPLLSDELVASVRVGVARGALAEPGAVTVSARSAVGVGVDMATEPEEALPAKQAEHTEEGEKATTPTPSTEAPVSLSSETEPTSPSVWGVSGVAIAALFLLVTAALIRARRTREEPERVLVRDDDRCPGGPPRP